ncbi:MAG: hypothetical protein PSV22_12020 [Pseudolabrys sp.]|jgi:trehalose-6-phosphatase|nr:hypothetical protein [Pseudolabrys sp.]
MHPPSIIPNPETERELRRAVLILEDDPRDETAFNTVLNFVSAHLRVGRNRTPTARRIARDQANV